MTPERYEEVGRLYHAAVELEPSRWAAYLAEACGGDDSLRQEVKSLLVYEARGERLIDQPALEAAAKAMAEDQSASEVSSLTVESVGHFQILSLLGKGGMGEVHLALDPHLKRKVAIKLLPARFTVDADRVRRFAQEARAASALNHPNILTIYEIGENEHAHYIVTEYVEGETLRQLLTSAPDQRLQINEALAIAVQIAEALAAAHEAGIVHRDIKPENVMVRRDGYVKVLDFGLAKLTETASPSADPQIPTFTANSTDAGMVMGTPRYMSPEQARGEKVDARTDIFSLGVMLYEMVAGRTPFAGATSSEVIAAILRDEPPPLAADQPRELERILRKALGKERDERYQTATALFVDLSRWKQQLSGAEKNGLPIIGASISSSPMAAADKLRYRRSVLFTLGSMVLIVAAAVYFGLFGGGGGTIDSLAVLPFVNVGANPDTEYLSDGITDGLINGLSQLPRLKVMSRNSVFRYKGKETDAQQAGNTLGVRAVLTGKVIQRGNELIVSAELVDVRDNSHLWGEQYNRKLSDLPGIQGELARDISQQLRLKLSTEAQQRLTKHGTENAEAYELYLKGRYSLNSVTHEGGKKSLEYFQRAIGKDPHYGLAYAGLAESYTAQASVGTTFAIPPKEAFSKAKAAALKAVELDDTLAEAHTSLAMIAISSDLDWNVAEREFKQAIALNPNYVVAHHFYSHYFISMGRFEESLAESQRALALDPFDVAMNFHLGFHYYIARQYDQAISQLQKTLAMNRNHSGAHGVLGLVYEQKGMHNEAIAELQRCMELDGDDMRGSLGQVYASSGQRGEARKLLDQLQKEAKHRYVSPYNIARIYAALGEKDQTFAALEKAYIERDANITDLKVVPEFDSLHSDPRFTGLLQRVGLSN